MATRNIARFGTIAVLAILVGILWASRAGNNHVRNGVERDPAYRVARAVRVTSVPLHATNGVVPEWLLEPGAGDRRIAGVVVDMDGEPVAGALVYLRSTYFALANILEPAITTDSLGRFDFGKQPATNYAVTAAAGSFQSTSIGVNLRNPNAEPTTLILEMPVCPRWLFGQVVDIQGGRVIDGSVSVRAMIGVWFDELYSVPLQADGSFSLCEPAVGRQVWVKAPGYGTVWLKNDMPREGWIVELHPGSSIVGRVVDSAGEPLSGASVVLDASMSSQRAFQLPLAQKVISQADGRFEFTGLAPGSYGLAADHASYATEGHYDRPRVTVRPGKPMDPVVIRMGSCRRLAGVVLSGGVPVVGAFVNRKWITQADGSFIIPCEGYEEVSLKVSGSSVENATVAAGREDMDDLVVRVQQHPIVAGYVTADGAPVQGAIIAVGDVDEAVSIATNYPKQHTRSDAEGRFQLDAMELGRFELVAWDPRSGRRAKRNAVEVHMGEAVDTVQLELEQAASIRGVVVDLKGEPIPRVGVSLYGLNPEDQRTRLHGGVAPSFETTTDEDGRFVFKGLSGADYAICLGSCYYSEFDEVDPRYPLVAEKGWSRVRLSDRSSVIEVQLVVAAQSDLSITGYIRFSTGEPAAFSVVRAGDARATTDEQGIFTLNGLTEGSYELTAYAQDGSFASKDGVVAGSSSVLIEMTPNIKNR